MKQGAGEPNHDVEHFAEVLLARSSQTRQSAYQAHAEHLAQQFAPSGDPNELLLVADQLLASAAAHAGSREVLVQLAAAVRRLARV